MKAVIVEEDPAERASKELRAKQPNINGTITETNTGGPSLLMPHLEEKKVSEEKKT